MSFPPGTEMFQFSGFASPKPILFSLVIPLTHLTPSQVQSEDWPGAKINGEGGFPHSEICGSKVAHTSPQLIAACHVLHRLCMPRHPPIALTSRLRIHTTNDRFGTRLSLECRARPRGLAGLVWPPVAAAPQGSSHSTQLDNHCVLDIRLSRSVGEPPDR